MIRRALFLSSVLLFAMGCPPKDMKGTVDAAAKGACAKVGESCELIPGKLGTCVIDDACTKQTGCFVCQSQH